MIISPLNDQFHLLLKLLYKKMNPNTVMIEYDLKLLLIFEYLISLDLHLYEVVIQHIVNLVKINQ